MKLKLLVPILLLMSCKNNSVTQKSSTKDDLTERAIKEEVKFEAKQFVGNDGSVLNYNIFNPGGNDKLPLFIFLHGAGERGDDNKSQLMHIAPILTNEDNQEQYPAILVFPQCPSEDYWANVNTDGGVWTVSSKGEVTPAMGRVIELIRKLRLDNRVDLSRVYLGGLSMGGFGTLDLLSRHADWFAGSVAICGGGDLEKSARYHEVPLWIYHGAKDSVVPVKLSRDLVQKIKAEGGNIKYTEYPEGQHNVWNNAFENPETLKWLFAQSK